MQAFNSLYHKIERDGAQVEAANQKELVRNTEAMFKNISEYIQGELLGTPNWIIEFLLIY
jgi:hypothetical protein